MLPRKTKKIIRFELLVKELIVLALQVFIGSIEYIIGWMFRSGQSWSYGWAVIVSPQHFPHLQTLVELKYYIFAVWYC